MIGEPKVLYDLRHDVFDSQVALAETNDLLALEDLDGMTGYAGATEALGAVLTNAGGGGTTGLTAIAARMEHARNIVLTLTGSNMTGGYVRALGIGTDGLLADELFTLTVAGTYTGKVPFICVREVHVWGITGTLDTTDEMSIGIGAKLGLLRDPGAVVCDVLKERHNQADIVVTPANINRQYGTYEPTSAPSATHIIELWYLTAKTLDW
jgi:hypothetical protein